MSTLLMLIFSVKLDLLPTYGLTSWKHYIMPVIALSLYLPLYISRLMRTSMLEVWARIICVLQEQKVVTVRDAF